MLSQSSYRGLSAIANQCKNRHSQCVVRAFSVGRSCSSPAPSPSVDNNSTFRKYVSNYYSSIHKELNIPNKLARDFPDLNWIARKNDTMMAKNPADIKHSNLRLREPIPVLHATKSIVSYIVPGLFQVMNRNARKGKRANAGKRPCSRIRRRAKKREGMNWRR